VGDIAAFESKPMAPAQTPVKAPAGPPTSPPGGGWTPEKAFDISLAVTLFGPPGLGLVYGPSIGHFAAGELGHGIANSLLRAALLAAPIAAQVAAARSDFSPRAAAVITGLSVVGLTTLVLYDLIDGRAAIARRARRR
jgi:hypothetical protein